MRAFAGVGGAAPRWRGRLGGISALTFLGVGGAFGLWSCRDATGPIRVADRIVFVTQPAPATAGAPLAPALRVALGDAAGRTVRSARATITLTLESSLPDAALAGVPSAATREGEASFAGLSIERAGAGYRLVARAEGFAPETSATFDVAPAAPVRLSMIVPPSPAVALAPIAPAVQVAVEDEFGNTVTTATIAVTLAFESRASAPAAPPERHTFTTNAVDGVATFSNIVLEHPAESYTATATAAGLSDVTSAAFAVAPAGSLHFIATPATTVVGQRPPTRILVEIRAPDGTPRTSATDEIVMFLADNPTGATLSGDLAMNAINGVGIFPDLSFDRPGTYTLRATAVGLTEAVSPPITALAAPPARILPVSGDGQTAPVGAALPQPLVVRVVDAAGAPVPGVTVAFEPAQGSASPAASPTDAAGMASSAWTLGTVAGPQTLLARLPGSAQVAGVQLSATAIAGGAQLLTLAGEPAAAAAGAPILTAAGQPLRVTVRDAFGNPLLARPVQVTAALGSNPGGGTLGGTVAASVDPATGIASFADLRLTQAASGYTLVFSSGAAAVTSAPFDIVPAAAAQLDWQVQPSTVTVNAIMAPPPAVRVLDAHGNVAGAASVAVTLALVGGDPSALSGNSAPSAGGVAQFGSLRIASAGSGLALRASAPGLTSATSLPFDVTAAPLTAGLHFTAVPPSMVVGRRTPTRILVEIRAADGTLRTGATDEITVSLGSNPTGATLTGDLAMNAIGGISTFPDLRIDRVGTYTLRATAPGLASAETPPIAVVPVPPAQLLKVGGDGQAAPAGTVLPAPLVVQVLDDVGAPVAGAIVMFRSSGGDATFPPQDVPTDAGGMAAASGWRMGSTVGDAFVTASLAQPSLQVTFRATATPGAVASLVFRAPPQAATTDDLLSGLQVEARDASGNLAATAAGTLLVETADQGPDFFVAGATVSQLAAALASGVATLPDFAMTRAGTRTIVVRLGGVAGSHQLVVSAGVPRALTVVSGDGQSGTVATVLPAPIRVRATDRFGNAVPATPVEYAPAQGAVSPAVVATDASGEASTQWTLGTIAAPHSLAARLTTNPAAPVAQITAIAVAGPAAALGWLVQPVGVVATVVMQPAPSVAVLDAFGNAVSAGAHAVTLALLGAGGATLSGASATTAAGIAQFPSLGVSAPATGVALRADAPGLTSATSQSFDVTAAPPTGTLQFAGVPATMLVGRAAGTAVRVEVRAGDGSLLTTATDVVTIALDANPTGATLSGTLSASAAGGVASFPGLSIDRVGSGYTLRASATGRTAGTSPPISVIPVPPAQLVKSGGDAQAVPVGAAVPLPLAVRVTDDVGAPVAGVTVMFRSSGGDATFPPRDVVTDAGGVAQASGWVMGTTAGDAFVTASLAQPALQVVFRATAIPGPAAALAFRSPPTVVTTDDVIGALQVEARDAFGNLATAAAGTATLATVPSGTDFFREGLGTGMQMSATMATGVATFPAFSMVRAGPRTLVARLSSLSVTQPVEVRAGTPQALAIAGGDGQSGTVGAALPSPLLVRATDRFANGVPGIAMTFEPAQGSAAPAQTSTDASGVAGTTWTLGALVGPQSLVARLGAHPGVPAVQFGAAAAAGAPAALAWLVQPGTVAANTAMAPAPSVTLRDAQGNVVTAGSVQVTLTLIGGSGAVLSGGSAVSVGGVAQFTNLRVSATGTGFTLRADAAGLSATSAAFAVTANGSLAFAASPTTMRAGQPASPAIQVEIRGAGGGVDAAAADAVTISLEANPGGATLGGTLTVNAAAGVATFSDLTLDRIGAGYTLRASAATRSGAVSAPITVDPGPPASLVAVSGDGQTALAGAPLAAPLVVRVADALGHDAPGVEVRAEVTQGGGAVNGAATASASTGPDGRASFAHTLGAAGSNAVRMSLPAAPAVAPLTFTATATAPANTPPVASITAPAEGALFRAGDVITYAGAGTDTEDGAIPAGGMSWFAELHHDAHTHPFLPATPGVAGGTVTIPAQGETSDNIWYRFHLTVTDAGGLSHATFRDILPRKSTLSFETQPAGLQITLDGQPRATPSSVLGVVGMQRELGAPSPQSMGGKSYTFVSWSDGGAQTHAIATPDANTTYTAVFAEVAPPNQPPSVAITLPAANSSWPVNAPVLIRANASDADGTVSQVVFFAGSTQLGVATSSPFETSWTPTSPGAYSLSAVATDDDLATATSAAVPVTVTPGGGSDVTPPAVTLTSPLNNAANLGGSVSLAATASDDVGVTGVIFQVDAETIGAEDTSPPYEATLPNTGAYASGQHVVRARARDAAGNLSPWAVATVSFGGSVARPQGFTQSNFVTGLAPATTLAFAPDGRLFICEQGGRLRVVKNGALLATPFATFPTVANGERGLLGVTFDPNFAANQYVYVYYTTTTAPIHNRVVRVTASGDVMVPGSEVVLLDLPGLSSATNHNGGALHFGPDGALYIAVGENANPSASQSLTTTLGKMLRINADGSIPADNPFAGSTTGQNRAIWALGLRNPFTFGFQPGTGRMFINDVGQSAWEEVNEGIAGSNYGWPTTEGYTTDPRFRSPLFAYPHFGGFVNGFSIVGAAFYNPPVATFPASYVGDYFFGDYLSFMIHRIDLDNDNAVYAFARVPGVIVDVRTGPDGALYVLGNLSAGWGVWRIGRP